MKPLYFFNTIVNPAHVISIGVESKGYYQDEHYVAITTIEQEKILSDKFRSREIAEKCVDEIMDCLANNRIFDTRDYDYRFNKIKIQITQSIDDLVNNR